MDLGMLQRVPAPARPSSLAPLLSPRSSQILPWWPELSVPGNLRWGSPGGSGTIRGVPGAAGGGDSMPFSTSTGPAKQ